MSDLMSMLVPLAGTFPGWPAADTPTPAEALLVLFGIPGLVAVVIAVLVFAGHLARQGRGAQVHPKEPLWVGGQSGELAPARAARELTTGTGDETTGGASVRW
jgi:hypothetical protein